MRSFIVPRQVINEHVVTSCEDCEYFENWGGSYGEYHACRHDDYIGYDSDIHYDGQDIPENCPRIKEEK